MGPARVARLLFVTHPEVIVDPDLPVTGWRLSPSGIRRMRQFAESAEAAGVAAVWASPETKAAEAAAILAARRGIPVQLAAELGENDRSATGFLPPEEFERTADAFFAAPHSSVRGWERAADAQRRIRAMVERIAAGHGGGDLAIVAHGAVGALLLCAWLGRPIGRDADQPFQGHYFAAALPGCTPLHGWKAIAPREG